MSERADWMHPEDEHLLALLRTERKDTFTAIAAQLPLPRERVAERCRTLAAHGLVEHLGSDIYTISPLGERYLDGEVGPAELRVTEHEDE
ncbi:helix-turn-helix domain-containing protein [Halorussus limi]|uniref:Helix-turn-helix domain-containing protein n=1 Tax=Halorussus limi TaxID=2938695 RepID=A0A8U0HW33_9EURY|nr:helix-turn-helix domain-containing protein [Halorussus limi]UPV74921.1 helix-turn-helix domain-containing protein [Halorussus limi]